MMHGRLQPRKSHRLGLRVSSCLAHKVSISGSFWGCCLAMSGIAAGDLSKPGNDHLCGVGESGSCPSFGGDSASYLSFSGRPIPERKIFAQVPDRVPIVSQAILGATSLGANVLGCQQWQRHGQNLERVHPKSKPSESRRQLRSSVAKQSAEWPINPAFSRNLKPPA